MKSVEQQIAPAPGGVTGESWLEIVRRQVGSLQFGVVQIVVHGSQVVQIERTEKLRLANPVAFHAKDNAFPVQTTGGQNKTQPPTKSLETR